MPALQVVLPWLLLLNKATTETSVVFTQGQGLPSSQSCSPSEYLIAGRCCKACPAGQHVGEHCRRPHSRGKCLPCLPGTFMNFLNGVEACFKCSTCSENEEVLEECTPTHDRVCQCRSDYFYAHVGSSEICSPCSTCPPGHGVLRRCNATADTVCRLPAPQRIHRCSLLGSLGFVLVVMCLNFWVTKRAGFPDGDAECVEMATVVPGRGRASSISASSVQLPQNSGSSMPSNQDGSAESSVPTRGNPNQPEDSVDIPTEAPAVTRALQSLEEVHGPQAVAGEGARALEWSPRPDPPAPAAPTETAELPTDLEQVTIAAGETTCHPDEYEVPGNPSCSRACPAGYYVSRPISLDHPIGACSPCERGTFRAHPSVETQCVPCGQCREDQEVVKQCSPTCDLECQCQQGRFFCDSVDCAESCIRCTSCEDSAVLQPCNATRDAVCATNPQSGNPGPPWACMGVDVHACTTIFVFIVIFIIIGAIVIRYFVVSCRRTGSRNMRSGYSPGTGQSSDLESGPPAPGGGAGLELRRNSASLASESPGSAEPLPCVNGSLAAPREPEEQARIPEAPRTTASQSHLPPLMSRSRSSDHPQCDENSF